MRRMLPCLAASLTLLLAAGCAYRAHLGRAEALAAQGDYPAAVAEYQAALAEKNKPRDNDVAQRIAAARQQWAACLATRAQAEQSAGRAASAAMLLDRAARLDPARAGAAAQALRKLRDENQLTIDLRPRDARSAGALATLRGRAASVEGLALLAPPPASAGAQPACGGADLWIDFFVTEPRLDFSSEIKPKLIHYPASVRKVPNPAYAAQQEAVRLARENYDAARKKADYDQETMVMIMGARSERRHRSDATQSRMNWDDSQQNMQRLMQQLRMEQDRLADLPRTVDEPVMKPYSFNETVHTQRASAFLGGKYGAAGAPEQKLARNLELVNTFEDYPAQDEPKLPALSPLMPTDDALKGVLTQQAGNALFELIQAQRARVAQTLAAQAGDPGQPAEARAEAAARALLLHHEGLSAERRKALTELAAQLLQLGQ